MWIFSLIWNYNFIFMDFSKQVIWWHFHISKCHRKNKNILVLLFQIVHVNPSPAEPGYTLPLQTV